MVIKKKVIHKPLPPLEEEESKDVRFKRVASRRTNTIIETLKLLSNCSDRNNYEYTPEQLTKIFEAINKALTNCKARFEGKDRPNKFLL